MVTSNMIAIGNHTFGLIVSRLRFSCLDLPLIDHTSNYTNEKKVCLMLL